MSDPHDRDDDGEKVRRRGTQKPNSEVRQHIDRLDYRIDGVEDDLTAVREGVARLEGGVEHLVIAYNRTADYAARQANAELDLRKSQRLQEIADSADQRKETSEEKKMRRELRRELALKGMMILMGAWAIVASAIAARC